MYKLLFILFIIKLYARINILRVLFLYKNKRMGRFSNLNQCTFKNCPHQKHSGIILDSKLNFNIHVDNRIKKCYKMIGLIKRLSFSVPRKALLTIYKSFIRPHLDCGDILYNLK